MTVSAPHWDLSNVYPSLESREFQSAIEDYKKQVAALEKFFRNRLSKANAKTKAADLAPLVGRAIDQINSIQSLSATIVPFIYSFVTTDSHNRLAMKALSEFEQTSLPMSLLMTQFTAWVGRLARKQLERLYQHEEFRAGLERLARDNVQRAPRLFPPILHASVLPDLALKRPRAYFMLENLRGRYN